LDSASPLLNLKPASHLKTMKKWIILDGII
jgi:hypothetical protein